MIRQYLNLAAPINRCPIEILTEIFGLSAMKGLPSYSPGHDLMPFVVIEKLHRISSVCCAWRTIVLSTPSLWCDLVFDRRRRKDLDSQALTLAKSSPLRLHARHLSKHSPSSGRALRILGDHGDRIREAYLRVENLGWNEVLDSLPAKPPLLVRLAIDSGHLFYPVGEFSPGKRYFGGIAQGLRHLCLHGISCLPTDQFPNLTHFDVSGANNFPLHTILSVLSNMPNLQTLIFALNVEEGSAAQCPRDAILELPHLLQFTAHNNLFSVCDVIQLLPRMKFPSICLVHIDEHEENNLFSIARLLYMQDFAQNLTRLRIMPHPTHYDDDEGEAVMYFLELLNEAGTSGLSLGIYDASNGLWTPEDRTGVTDTLADFLSSSVGVRLVSNVRELWVHMWTDLVNDRLLAVIPPIDTLGLVLARPPYVPTEIPECLGQLVEEGTFVFCPDLTSLYVYTCEGEDIDRARVVATARKDAGRPLQRVAIECEQKLEVRSQALELEGLVHELSVTIEGGRNGWWTACAIPDGWSRHGPSPWPERREWSALSA